MSNIFKADFNVESIRRHLAIAREDMERFGANYTVGTINLDYLEYMLELVESKESDTSSATLTTNPLEQIVERSLIASGTKYHTEFDADNITGLDFYLPQQDIYLEVKAMHSERISEQMSRASNVIAVQGKQAVEWFASLIRSRK